MSRIHGYTRLLVIAAALALLTACSAPVGPSADKARLDRQDRFDATYRGMIPLTDFEVTRRNGLAEDRVKRHIATGVELDRARVEQFQKQQKRSGRLFGYGNVMLDNKAKRFYQRFRNTANEVVLVYRRTGAWTLTGIHQ